MTEEHITHLLEQAIGAATLAANYIRLEVGKQREVLKKEGGSTLASQVVTEVDFESQRIILEVLAPTIGEFQLGLLTEESADNSSRHECEYFWCIDPLDGTLAFTENIPGYSVSIALVSKSGAPEIGVIVDPSTATRYHAVRGRGAFRNMGLWEPQEEDGAPLAFVMDRSLEKQENYPAILDAVRLLSSGEPKIINRGGAAMNACWALENAPGVYFKLPKPERGGGSIWDFAASACLFTELGGIATDFGGAPLDLNPRCHTFMNEKGVVFATDQKLADPIYQLVR